MNAHELTIPEVLRDCKTIAVVGLSSNPEKPSHEVAAYLQGHGYRIVPVNPTYAGNSILGEHCYPTLTQAARSLAEQGVHIDVADCFRQPQYMAEIAAEAVAVRARVLWMQLSIINEAAAAVARRAGLTVVMDRCLKIEHMRHS